MDQLTVDVDDQVAVLGIKFLQHEVGTIAQENRKAGNNLRFLLLPVFLLS